MAGPGLAAPAGTRSLTARTNDMVVVFLIGGAGIGVGVFSCRIEI
jgi:hypothetical protein